jgi:carboxymethylenebutenolidase
MSRAAGRADADYAQAEQVSFNDPAIKARYVNFPVAQGTRRRSRIPRHPDRREGKAGLVLVVHENRGLNPYIADVARRVAKAGFVAFAPDALHPKGGYPGNDDEGRALQGLDGQGAKIEQDFIAAAKFLKAHEGSATASWAPLDSASAVTSSTCWPPPCPTCSTPAFPSTARRRRRNPEEHQGTPDDPARRTGHARQRKLARLRSRTSRPRASNYTMHMYPKCNHGFHNDSTGRYDEKNAQLAWDRTLAFFRKHLASA